MKEKLIYQKVHSLLAPSIHHQSMTGAAMTGNGIPDQYYDGCKLDLWIEYKQISRWPQSGIVKPAPIPNVKKQPQGHLTALQAWWIERRWVSGQNAIVVVGLPNKCVVVLKSPLEIDRGKAVTTAITVAQLAHRIEEFCNQGIKWTRD